ncbi:peptidyl-glycine alpha-amidating monooxygenase B-like [Dermatophagoides pteronyssinus]|uniref:peptidyl-glycine alpha-amidating monooxygenase B-like n=1 Tax=Dermatophagoides pteronyssinus TaxID=6956 RepID=UPI003F66137D
MLMNMNHTFEFSLLFSIIIILFFSTKMVKLKIVPKKSLSETSDLLYTLELKMPNVLPRKNDDYLCTSVNISNEEIYIKKFDPNANSNRIHHIIIFGCKNLQNHHNQLLYPNHWPCIHLPICPGMRIIYAWGRNAPSLQLPPDVGFHVGGLSDINYLILQSHYSHPLQEHDSSGVRLLYTVQPQPYIAGILLLSSVDGIIPPHQSKYHVDINCRLNRDPITVFAYRVHAHALGTVISGYRYSHNKNKWDLIAKGNPQWPQAFYPMSDNDNLMQINSQDIIAARCTYNSSERNTLTRMGSTAGDEMCNLYLMYYSENPLLMADDSMSKAFFYSLNEQRSDIDSCSGIEFESDLYLNLPDGNDQPLPRNITLEQSAIGQHSSHQHVDSNHSDGDVMNEEESARKLLEFIQDPDWPANNFQFGQITAVDFDQSGNVVIFHRGKHVWNELSFDWQNNYRRIQNGPIAQSTIITIDPKSGKILDSWGENLFFMPHGLTIDQKNHSIWLTDVAMHQIFRYSLNRSERKQPLLVLGERFKPGDDDKHFCKPTSVAIDYNNGDLYVADGYCNSRIIRFDSNGKYLNHWGHKPIINSGDLQSIRPSPNSLNVPHKILLIDQEADDEKLACIADRENGRIECFLTPYGQFRFQIRLPQFNGRLFSIAYSKQMNILYAVNGPSLMPPPPSDMDQKSSTVMAFAFDFQTQQPLATFVPKLTGTFNQPHDLAVSPSGNEVFVVEIGPNYIWKFINSKPMEQQQPFVDKMIVDKLKSKQAMKIISNNGMPIKSKILTNNTKDKSAEIDEKEKKLAISNVNFSFELLQIRTKEFREKVWSNNILYFVLLALFIFIMILNIHHTSSTLRFFSLIFSSLLNSMKFRLISNRSTKMNSERISLSNVLKSSSSSKRKSLRLGDKRYGGFNRLPQNEEESDLVIVTDDDSNDDDSDVLEDFSLSQQQQLQNNNNSHVI